VPAPRRTPVIVAWAARLLRVRWIVRAPVWLFRARLGFVFGSRLLMLEHIGRKTGKRRYVVLEAIDHPSPRTYVVASGFGDRAQWLRNVHANHIVHVYTGARRAVPGTARPLTPQETAAALTAYARRHPRAWAALRPVFETTLGARINCDGTTLPMIALDLAESHRRRGALAPGVICAPRSFPRPGSGWLRCELRAGAEAVVVRDGLAGGGPVRDDWLAGA